MKKLLVSLIVLCSSTCCLYSQNKTIKGRVVDDNLETLPYLTIMINDTIEVGKTDMDGFFKVDIPASVKILLFSNAIGIESTSIELLDKCDEVDVVMMLRGTYDFKSLKKADRLRMKRYKKLPKLHAEAFKKGLFKTEKACYTRAFMPYYGKR